MSTRLIWIVGGGIFGALLSIALDNTPIGIAITAVIGGIAGGISEHLRRRPHK